LWAIRQSGGRRESLTFWLSPESLGRLQNKWNHHSRSSTDCVWIASACLAPESGIPISGIIERRSECIIRDGWQYLDQNPEASERVRRYDTVRSDSKEQVEQMVVTARDYGADFVSVGGLTLFGKGPLKTARRL